MLYAVCGTIGYFDLLSAQTGVPRCTRTGAFIQRSLESVSHQIFTHSAEMTDRLDIKWARESFWWVIGLVDGLEGKDVVLEYNNE